MNCPTPHRFQTNSSWVRRFIPTYVIDTNLFMLVMNNLEIIKLVPVPQDCVLEPILFTIHVLPLGGVIRNQSIHIH